MPLILGSGSPRRRDLLAQIGVTPDDVRPPDIDESPKPGELPRPYCTRMALEKACATNAAGDDLVLSADTTVSLGRTILGKAESVGEAEAYLRWLSGRRHRVITAIALRRGDKIWQRDSVSVVQMKRLDDVEIEAYLDSRDWMGKAGGYGIQGLAGAFIPWIRGSYTGIVGLPLAETMGLLRAAGYKGGIV